MTLAALIRSPSGIVVIETILLACLTFGTFSVLVRVTDMETVGLWVLVNSLLGFSRAADFWSRGLSSFAAEALGKGEPGEAAAFVSTAVLTGAAGYGVLATLGATVIWLFAEPLAGQVHAPLVREIVPLMGLTFWLLSVSGIYQGGFLAFGRPGLKATQTAGGAFVFLGVALLLAPRYGLWGILTAQALQGAAMLAYSAAAFHGFLAGGKPTWRRDKFQQLVSFGSKAIAVGTLQLAIEPVIRLLANQFGGLGTVASVELASRFIGIVRSLITSIGQILVPQFARLGAQGKDELPALYKDMNRLFLVASLSGFSLLATAAPAVEELVLGRTGTGFVPYLWILSVGWFANTVTSPAFFHLLAQRRLRPLFWTHAIMTGGAAVLGMTGGVLAGASGALTGATLAIAASSLYLIAATQAGEAGPSGHAAFLKAEPALLLPVLSAVAALTMLQVSGLLNGDTLVRAGAYAAAIATTLFTCLIFGDIRSLLHTAARIR
jgi:O-antigen/teichoic acid export membrane protein